jgi:hypothetical protein
LPEERLVGLTGMPGFSGVMTGAAELTQSTWGRCYDLDNFVQFTTIFGEKNWRLS